MPLISIIVPVYKAERYLHRCVDSILGQSFEDFTLVLVDDGSPDKSGLICDEYKARDNRVHVIHQANAGVAVARNRGLDWVYENCDSQWIAFVDSDDWLHRNYLQALHDASQEADCLLRICDYAVTRGEDIPEANEISIISMSADDYFCNEESEGMQAAPWGKLFHRSLLQTVRFPAGRFAEDEFTIYLPIYAAGTVSKVCAKLYAYFQNPGSVTKSDWHPRKLDALEALREQIVFAEIHNNGRLLARAADGYVWNMKNQILQISDAMSRNEAYIVHQKKLRNELKMILKQGFHGRRYPLSRKNLELYEVAYPLPIWKTLHQIYGKLKKNQ